MSKLLLIKSFAALLIVVYGSRTVHAGNLKGSSFVQQSAALDGANQMVGLSDGGGVFKSFAKGNPAPYWLFGEDRQAAVVDGVVPERWIVNSNRHYNRFFGIARPGEYYVFQVCVVGGKKKWYDYDILSRITSINGASVVNQDKGSAVVGSLKSILTVPTVDLINRPSEPISYGPKEIKTLWFGVQIPEDAVPGSYEGVIDVLASSVRSRTPSGFRSVESEVRQSLSFSLKVEGTPLADGGTSDAWRLSRLKWLNFEPVSSAANDNKVVPPFIPIKVDESSRGIDILGRRIVIGENGLPSQFYSHFENGNREAFGGNCRAFSSSPYIEYVSNGKSFRLNSVRFSFTKVDSSTVEWCAECRNGEVVVDIHGSMTASGQMCLEVRPFSGVDVELDDLRVIVPYLLDSSRYVMGMGLVGGLTPDSYEWRWNVQNNQDAIWLGSPNIGTMIRLKSSRYERPLIGANYVYRKLDKYSDWLNCRVSIARIPDSRVLSISTGAVGLHGKSSPVLKLDWFFTPFKTLDLRQRFADGTIGACFAPAGSKYCYRSSFAAVDADDLYSDAFSSSIGRVLERNRGNHTQTFLFCRTQSVKSGLPEFAVMKSIGSIFVDGQNFTSGDVIAVPDSQWDKFCLKKLDSLLSKCAIDALILEDSSVGGEFFQHIKQMMRSNAQSLGGVGVALPDYFNKSCGWSNSCVDLMECIPYCDVVVVGGDSLTGGAPERALVEFSGIPFGVAPVLRDPIDVWHAMVFGADVLNLSYVAGDGLREFIRSCDLANAHFVGWWDSANPVRVDRSNVKASLYRYDGRAVVVLAAWGAGGTVKLDVDWRALGINPDKAVIYAPQIFEFQQRMEYSAETGVSVPANQGVFLVIESGR